MMQKTNLTKAEQVAREHARLAMLLAVKKIEAGEKLKAAKRALGLANKLKRGDHKSRILSAMNKLRVAAL